MMPQLFALLAILALAVLAAYGGHVIWEISRNWMSQRLNRRGVLHVAAALLLALAFATVAVSLVMPDQVASAQSFDVDLQPFFDNLNIYLPLFISIFAIVGGIAGAIALAKLVINAIVKTFQGGSL